MPSLSSGADSTTPLRSGKPPWPRVIRSALAPVANAPEAQPGAAASRSVSAASSLHTAATAATASSTTASQRFVQYGDTRKAGGDAGVRPYSRAEVICLLDEENRELRADLSRSMNMLRAAQRAVHAKASDTATLCRIVAEGEAETRQSILIAEAEIRATFRAAQRAMAGQLRRAAQAATAAEELHRQELESIGEEWNAQVADMQRRHEWESARLHAELQNVRRRLTAFTAKVFVDCSQQTDFPRRDLVVETQTDAINEDVGAESLKISAFVEYLDRARRDALAATEAAVVAPQFLLPPSTAVALESASTQCGDGDLAFIAPCSHAPVCGQWLIPVETAASSPSPLRGAGGASPRRKNFAEDRLCAHMLEVDAFVRHTLPLLELWHDAAADALMVASAPMPKPKMVDRSTWCTQPPSRHGGGPATTARGTSSALMHLNQNGPLSPLGTKTSKGATSPRAKQSQVSPSVGTDAAAVDDVGATVMDMTEKFIDEYLNPSAELDRTTAALHREVAATRRLRMELARSREVLKQSREEARAAEARCSQMEGLVDRFSTEAARAKNILAALERELGVAGTEPQTTSRVDGATPNRPGLSALELMASGASPSVVSSMMDPRADEDGNDSERQQFRELSAWPSEQLAKLLLDERREFYAELKRAKADDVRVALATEIATSSSSSSSQRTLLDYDALAFVNAANLRAIAEAQTTLSSAISTLSELHRLMVRGNADRPDAPQLSYFHVQRFEVTITALRESLSCLSDAAPPPPPAKQVEKSSRSKTPPPRSRRDVSQPLFLSPS